MSQIQKSLNLIPKGGGLGVSKMTVNEIVIAKLNLNSTQLNSTQTEVEMVYIST